MRDYDPAAPMIFIHVPKTAGTSVRTVLERWFGDSLYLNYFSEAHKQMPDMLDLGTAGHPTAPPVIYGHFNKNRGFGIRDYYPQVRQFVTILRNPLDMHVSTYFFIRKNNTHPLQATLLELTLEEFVRTHRPNMLEHFPSDMDTHTYRDVIESEFIDIGCYETLGASLHRIGTRLGKPVADLAVPHLNAAARDDQQWAHLAPWFRARWPLEHMIYDYARAMAP